MRGTVVYIFIIMFSIIVRLVILSAPKHDNARCSVRC